MKKRKSIRLKNYDYAQAGIYFVTVCVQEKEQLFGNIGNNEMILNDAGEMIDSIWRQIPQYYDGIEIDIFQIMPNHMHGIIKIVVGATPCGCPISSSNGCPNDKGNHGGIARTGLSLGDIVSRFKSLTTRRYIKGVCPKFNYVCEWGGLRNNHAAA